MLASATQSGARRAQCQRSLAGLCMMQAEVFRHVEGPEMCRPAEAASLVQTGMRL